MASNSKNKKKRPVYEPTQKDIRDACDAIKARLSDAEIAKRMGIVIIPWTPDVLDTSLLARIISSHIHDD